MGIHISRTAALAPISAASTVIGFVSFGVTVGTFLRVFWGNIQTVMHARREIPVSAECVNLAVRLVGCVLHVGGVKGEQKEKGRREERGART